MAGYVRCKACGYIMSEDAVKDCCPACGLPKTVFEPYTKKISPRRKMLLDQHFHPIAVHFPQVLLFLGVILPLMILFTADPLRNELYIMLKWSVLAMPFTVFLGFITGLIDGKLRFKKLDPPLLKNKIIAGLIFQALSIIPAVAYGSNGFTGHTLNIILVVNVISMPLAIYLGRVGSSMFDAIMPG